MPMLSFGNEVLSILEYGKSTWVGPDGHPGRRWLALQSERGVGSLSGSGIIDCHNLWACPLGLSGWIFICLAMAQVQCLNQTSRLEGRVQANSGERRDAGSTTVGVLAIQRWDVSIRHMHVLRQGPFLAPERA